MARLAKKVLAVLEAPPPKGQAVWDGPAVARHLKTSVHAVWRVLRKEGVCLGRQRSWCVSTDPEFSTKAADIVGLYLNPPEKALVISVDENPASKRWSGRLVRGDRQGTIAHRFILEMIQCGHSGYL